MRLILVLAVILFSANASAYWATFWGPYGVATEALARANGCSGAPDYPGHAIRCHIQFEQSGQWVLRKQRWIPSANDPTPCDDLNPDIYWDQTTQSCKSPEPEPEPDPDCSDTPLQGDVYDSITEQCACPSGTIDVLGPNGYYCGSPEAPTPECKPDDPAFRGYLNNTAICDWDEQCPPGHNGGLVDGKWRCIETPPQCKSGQLYVNGSCIGPGDQPSDPSDPNDPDDPNDPNNPNNPDGNGRPGTPGSPITPGGPGQGTDDFKDEDGGFAQASGSCSVRPSCEGDSAQCAILLQQWYNGCKAERSEFGDPISGDGTESWFQTSYPDGFSGIFDSKRQAVEDGAMVSWLGSWGVASSGTCPSFNIDLNLGFINFGSFNALANWCYIFDFIRICILISAAFACRALIFGG